MALDELHGFGQALLEFGEIDWIVFEIWLEEDTRNRLHTCSCPEEHSNTAHDVLLTCDETYSMHSSNLESIGMNPSLFTDSVVELSFYRRRAD